MYFITQSDPNIFLIGVDETQIYGFGEKNGKLCIYTKAIFDIGEWKEFYMININVVKCKRCNTGIHVAGGVCSIDQIKTVGIMKKQAIWIAAREGKYTRIFSINIDTKKFNRYKMLQETYPEFALLNLNLCCKCINPIIRFVLQPLPGYISFIIVPQKYQSETGILQIRATINQSNYCLLWKKVDSLTLLQPPHFSSSNILTNEEGHVYSVCERNEENGRILRFSNETADSHIYIIFPDHVWHEIAFSSFDGMCLTRRKEGDKSFLQLYYVSLHEQSVDYTTLDCCTFDANFPSLESISFFVAYRIVDEEYAAKKTKSFILMSELYAIPSFIVFQAPVGIVVIPLRILSLSEIAYLSLARIAQSNQHHHSSLPVAKISLLYYFFQRIRNLCGQSKQNISKYQQDPWMSQTFIKTAIGWPRILPLVKAPKLPLK